MKPEIRYFEKVYFVGKNVKIPFAELETVVSQTLPELHANQGIEFDKLKYPAIQYLDTSKMEMVNGKINIRIGMVTEAPVYLKDYTTSIFPEGDYAVLTHKGNYNSLVKTNGILQQWAVANNIKFQKDEVDGRLIWTSRLEIYLKGPESDSNPKNWVTEVRYLIKPQNQQK